MNSRSVFASLCLVLLGQGISAQEPVGPTFEVASIKPNESLGAAGSIGYPPGRFIARNTSLREVIRFAFHMDRYQIVGGPGWTDSEHYDVEGTTGGASLDDKRLMVQRLLADRSHLAVHFEDRPVMGYELVRVSENKLGSRIRRSAFDCDQPNKPAPCNSRRIDFGTPNELARGATNSLTTIGSSLNSLITDLKLSLNAPIVDRTGLVGTFDYEVLWASSARPSPDVPDLSTAIREQLGLKLVATRIVIKYLVIDRVDRPTPN